LLKQDFVASRPNEKWTGDITAVWTYEGWLYLAVVLDLFSRQVVGWAMAATQDETLVEGMSGTSFVGFSASNRCSIAQAQRGATSRVRD
jgi:transposase InsO family protein